MSEETNQLQDNMKDFHIRFDQLRSEIVEKLTEFNEQVEKKTIFDDQHENLSNKEKESKDIKVNLNVGGDRFTTTVQTLTQEKDTFFTALFSKQWKLKVDPNDKSIFIDRDGILFRHILNYLRTNYIPDDFIDNDSLRQLLIIEAKYFRLHQLIHQLTELNQRKEEERQRQRIAKYFVGGTLLQIEHKKKLNEFYGKAEQTWTLIYKATRDGFGAKEFHEKCDGRGPTMSIILSKNNYLFGGFASASWTPYASHTNDMTAFLFTLTNPHNIAPTKYLMKDYSPQPVPLEHCYGPTFGSNQHLYVSEMSCRNANALFSHHNIYHSSDVFVSSWYRDLYVSNISNENADSHIGFPNSYIDTTGQGNNTFTGAANFTTSEIEVYRLW